MDNRDMNNRNQEFRIEDVIGHILEDYRQGKDIDQIDVFDKPDKERVIEIVDKLLQIIFPGYFRDRTLKIRQIENSLAVLMEEVFCRLKEQILLALGFCRERRDAEPTQREREADRICVSFFRKIPEIREMVETDLQAAFDGDPAAGCKEEVILAYPGLMASTVNRIAHELYLLDVPLIPRLMTEYAHSRTGIDLHPGVTIGKYFFMDHGTGIVVGETAVIGDNVKLYQGVTIGALSTRGGQKLYGKKRHPTIEDNVTIYAGASVLGGDTVIGENSVIGSNVFLTSSIPKDTVVTIKAQELEYRH